MSAYVFFDSEYTIYFNPQQHNIHFICIYYIHMYSWTGSLKIDYVFVSLINYSSSEVPTA